MTGKKGINNNIQPLLISPIRGPVAITRTQQVNSTKRVLKKKKTKKH
jgi:hypothetical protein